MINKENIIIIITYYIILGLYAIWWSIGTIFILIISPFIAIIQKLFSNKAHKSLAQ